MESTTRQRVTTHRRRRMSDEQWDLVRPILKRLYYDQGNPLLEVKKIIEESHNFKASEKTWKDKIKAWGLKKNRARATSVPQPGIASRTKLVAQQRVTNSQTGSNPDNEYQPSTSNVKLDSTPPAFTQHAALAAHCPGCTCPEPNQGKGLNWHEFSLEDLNAILVSDPEPQSYEEYTETIAKFRKAHSKLENLLGPTNETTLDLVSRIVSLCHDVHLCHDEEAGKALALESERILVPTVAKLETKYGTANATTLKYSECLARNLQIQARWGESEVILDQIVYGYRQLYKENPAIKLNKLKDPVLMTVDALAHQQKIDRIEEVLLEAVQLGKAISLSEQHENMIFLRSSLLRFYAMGYGKAGDAEDFLLDSLQIFENMVEFRPMWADFVLPTILRRQVLANNLLQSLPLLEMAEAALKKSSITSLQHRVLSRTLAGAYILLEKIPDAERCLENCFWMYEDQETMPIMMVRGCIYHHHSRWDDAVFVFEQASRRCNEARSRDRRDEALHRRVRDSLRQAKKRLPLSKQDLNQIIREMLAFDSTESFQELDADDGDWVAVLRSKEEN